MAARSAAGDANEDWALSSFQLIILSMGLLFASWWQNGCLNSVRNVEGLPESPVGVSLGRSGSRGHSWWMLGMQTPACTSPASSKSGKGGAWEPFRVIQSVACQRRECHSHPSLTDEKLVPRAEKYLLNTQFD